MPGGEYIQNGHAIVLPQMATVDPGVPAAFKQGTADEASEHPRSDPSTRTRIYHHRVLPGYWQHRSHLLQRSRLPCACATSRQRLASRTLHSYCHCRSPFYQSLASTAPFLSNTFEDYPRQKTLVSTHRLAKNIKHDLRDVHGGQLIKLMRKV